MKCVEPTALTIKHAGAGICAQHGIWSVFIGLQTLEQTLDMVRLPLIIIV